MKNLRNILLFAMVGCFAACTMIPGNNLPEPISFTETSQEPSDTPGVFTLTSTDVKDGGRLPAEYTCDGNGSTLALSWSGAPSSTVSYAILMDHIAAPDDIHWYWILYDIPGNVTSIPKNSTGIGTLGSNINNSLAEYSPPCSQGPGDKVYSYTIYALSEYPEFPSTSVPVNRLVLLETIKQITLSQASLSVIYARESSMISQDSSPATKPGEGSSSDTKRPDVNAQYNIEQAISDKAQGMTIAYDALAFLTGDFGSNSFFPPGKVADFWGFQYLRDNDSSNMGHAGDFLTRAAMNMLNILTTEQRTELIALAKDQVEKINEYGYKRLILVQAFQDLLTGHLPPNTTGLNEDAVKAFSGDLYELDGMISFQRAELMGKLVSNLTTEQRTSLDSLVGKGMLEWPDVPETSDLKNLDRDVKVAVMTYAADMFAWYAGSVEADVYFCPERHGTYFGSFYLKDIKAMSDPSYSIPTDMTGNMGDNFLGLLQEDQALKITNLVATQKPTLQSIVETRRLISVELRKFLEGGTGDKATVLALMQQYGELDGQIIYNMAIRFADVNNSLTSEQRTQIEALRTELLGELSHPIGAFLYSEPIPMPVVPDSSFLFK